ncbi:MAG: Holliday junction resolvase RuvX [Chromatiales bacterium]|jgi:putative Holliday junction resolvase|nr:Holliday junction resolvase RuvX [Chromatiales bacterium]
MKGSRTLLGFDYGSRKIGIAVGQELTGSSTPLITLRHSGGNPDWDAITRLITQWRPAALVVGIPLNMDDSEQPMTAAARRFARRLNGRYGLPVFETDERLSSRAALDLLHDEHEHGRRHLNVDEVAAHVILQTFFSRQQSGDSQ